MQGCLHKWLDMQRTTGGQCTCPICRRKLRYTDLRHDPAIQQQLQQLKVLCPNASAGCGAVMTRAEVAGHLQHTCLYEQVSCSYCGTQGMRSAIQEHEASGCSQRPVPCINSAAGCDAVVPLQSMLLHVDFNCRFTARPCPHCHTEVPRCVDADRVRARSETSHSQCAVAEQPLMQEQQMHVHVQLQLLRSTQA